MTTKDREEEVRGIVRDYYGEMGRTGSIPNVACCGSQTADLARRSGYTDAELTAVPDGANLGVGCGAPLAEAMLEPGEVVLDLGSGPTPRTSFVAEPRSLERLLSQLWKRSPSGRFPASRS